MTSTRKPTPAMRRALGEIAHYTEGPDPLNPMWIAGSIGTRLALLDRGLIVEAGPKRGWGYRLSDAGRSAVAA